MMALQRLQQLTRNPWVRNVLWLMAILLMYYGARTWQQWHLPKGQAPELVGMTVTGERASLSDYRGQPVMLYFWATWCPICEAEQGSIESIAADHPVLSVAMRSGNAMQVNEYMEQHGLKLKTIVDEFGGLSARYRVKGTPTAFFIDAQGNIRSIEVGYTTGIGMRVRLWLAGI